VGLKKRHNPIKFLRLRGQKRLIPSEVLLTKDSKISEAIFKDPSILPLLARYDISLGVGDATVSQVCAEHGIGVDFFLAVVNTFLNEDYFPGEDARRKFTMEEIRNYLLKTDRYYSMVQLPNIERHFNSLIRCSGGEGNNLELLRRFFLEMKGEFESAIESDAVVLGNAPADSYNSLSVTSRAEVEEKIADLLAFFVLHLRGNYDRNLCTAVVTAVFMLDKDVRQNNRIRSRILSPGAYE